MEPDERLVFHRNKSSPFMEEIHAYAKGLLENRKAEPNGTLGDALKYLLKNWAGLTQFLWVPGAPLDNNIADGTNSTAHILDPKKNTYNFKKIYLSYL